jgi:hypothetical protein
VDVLTTAGVGEERPESGGGRSTVAGGSGFKRRQHSDGQLTLGCGATALARHRGPLGHYVKTSLW